MTAASSEFTYVSYEVPEPGIARIKQDRPEARNAQDLNMLYALNDALNKAAQDPEIKVIIVGGADPHFSSGHDLKRGDQRPGRDFEPVSNWSGFDAEAVDRRYSTEQEIYLEMLRRWRNLPKPTIAQVQGKCIAGGLANAWFCDMIVASDDAMFADVVAHMGVCGIEYFAHPYELGPRKAKEMLMTADWWTAEEAKQWGMVNHVVPRAELESFTLALANKVADKPSFVLKMIKQAVNIAVDNMGQRATMDAVFGLHHLCHAQEEELRLRRELEDSEQTKPAQAAE